MKKTHRRLSPPRCTANSRRALGHVLTTGAWARGTCVERLEALLADRSGVHPTHVVCTASCTDALAAVGRVLLENHGTLRFCPLTYAGTYSWNSRPLEWVDCEDGYPSGPVDVSVDLWGLLRPTTSAVVVDAAHRFRPEEVVGHLSRGAKAVCWSFGPTKELHGLCGGAAVFAKWEDAYAARTFLNNGIGPEGPTGGPGRKGYMTNAAAGFLLQQLHSLPDWTSRRQDVLAHYERFFPRGSDVAELMTLPGEASGHLAVLRFSTRGERDLARESLSRERIETSVHYPVPEGSPPGCVELSGRILSVPCHSEMMFRDVRQVAMRIFRA